MRWIAMKYAIINRKDEGIYVMYLYKIICRRKKLWCINFIHSSQTRTGSRLYMPPAAYGIICRDHRYIA